MSKVMQRIGWGAMFLAALSVVAISVSQYASLDPLELQNSPVFGSRFLEGGAYWLYLHVFASVFALLLGPFQFVKSLRTRYLRLHRWVGRLYLGIGITLGGISGLVVAQETVAGLTGRFGFSMLALLWLYSGAMAYWTIRNRRIREHQNWMIRNYALTFAAVTLRLYLGLGMALLSPLVPGQYADMEALFLELYRLVPWLCWVPNWLIAEAYISYRQRKESFHIAHAGQPAAPQVKFR